MLLTDKEVAILDDLGYELRDDYSGRGMYGATTQAIVASSKDMVISDLTGMIDYELENAPEPSKEKIVGLTDLIKKITSSRTDNMGKYDIVIY